MRLENKVAIITGGANGIGRAAAILMGREGARVVVADRDATAGEACAGAIREAGGQAIFVKTDVSSDADVQHLVAETVQQFGGVDILVNCAGVDITGTVTSTEPERWNRLMDVNLTSIYRTCREAIPHMIQRQGGAIVNVASLQGMYGYPNYAAYAASKAAIIGLTRQVAVDYAPFNIRSNAISPGSITTDLGANSDRLEPQYAYDPGVTSRPAAQPAPSTPPAAGKRSRLRGSGRPEDVGYAILFLASDEAAHISGHNLVVAGITQSRMED
ncbi:MAG: SDR family oxidoreductase [Chloroflexi bacterium]|nr:SDR family oxidoreductase [Chloroflexota bacterium]